MDDTTQVFVLFANCVPVKGARRSIICDLQMGRYYFIPNALYEISAEHEGWTIAAIKEGYQRKHDSEIDSYFSFLLAIQLGWYCPEPFYFPRLDLTWKAPAIITNAIIDLDPADAAFDYLASVSK